MWEIENKAFFERLIEKQKPGGPRKVERFICVVAWIMRIFKTRYKVRQQSSTWDWVILYRKWYLPYWRVYWVGGWEWCTLKDALSLIPADGVIVI